MAQHNGGPMTTPLSVLRESIRAVPAVRYALGIAGIASVIAIVRSFHLEPKVAVIGMITMLFFMVMLVVFAHLTSLASADFRIPALVFTWCALLLMIAFAVAMFTSVFFKWPISDLRHLVDGNSPPDATATVERERARAPAQNPLSEEAKPSPTKDGTPATSPKEQSSTTPEQKPTSPESANSNANCTEVPFTDYTKNPPEFKMVRNCD
jgi:hypothetical protein